jgi:protein arginine N-methyltransferase 1
MKMVELNQIKYIKSTVEDIATDEIPQVDVIISEWMGYFLLFENMVGSYIHSIKKFLKPDGIMIPSKAVMYLNAAAYDTKANKIAKKYLQGSYKVVKIMQCEASNLV